MFSFTVSICCLFGFFFNDTATTETYTYGHTLSLHDALPIFEALGIDEGTFDGELIALTDKGNDDFALLQRVISGNANAPLKYMLFDMTALAGQDVTATRRQER